MRILIFGINYAPEPIGIGPYTAGMARELARFGHDVSVVAGKPYYPDWKVDNAFRGMEWAMSVEDGVSVLRCPLYVPSQPSGAKRLVHHASFAASAMIPMLARARRFRPHLVIAIAPSLIAFPAAILAARFAGARLWLHIQDFEVEAAFATGLLARSGRIGRWASRFEAAMIRQAGRVSTISPQMCAKLVEKGVAENAVVEFRNWASLDQVTPLERPSSYRTEWGIDAPHVALYSGNIANKQGIEIVVETARRLAYRKDLRFVVCGNGSNRDALERSAADIGNIMFRDLQPKERLGELMGLATVHLLPQMADAADLVLPSKLTNMLASGRPVIATAVAGTGLATAMEGCGLLVAPGDAQGMANAIIELLDDTPRRIALGAEARRRAERSWGRDGILAGLAAEIAAFVPDQPPSPAGGRLAAREN